MSQRQGSSKDSCGCCGGEFRCSNFGLEYENPDDFKFGQWDRPSILFVIYRSLVVVYFVAWLVVQWVRVGPVEGAAQLRYFTEWAYDIYTLTLIIQAIIAIIGYSKKQNAVGSGDGQMTWDLKMLWVLHNVSTGGAVTLTLGYWVLLFDPSNNTTPLEWALDIQRHVLQSVFVVIDLYVIAIPIRIYHMIHTMILGLTFALFSLAYNLTGNDPIYSYLNWKDNPKLAGLASVGLIFGAASIVWLCLFGLYKLRCTIFEHISGGRPQSSTRNDMEMRADPNLYV